VLGRNMTGRSSIYSQFICGKKVYLTICEIYDGFREVLDYQNGLRNEPTLLYGKCLKGMNLSENIYE
jgi:hypothetical protein